MIKNPKYLPNKKNNNNPPEITDERVKWAGYYNADPDKKETAAGKTVAWINYMTNVNRTYRKKYVERKAGSVRIYSRKCRQ